MRLRNLRRRLTLTVSASLSLLLTLVALVTLSTLVILATSPPASAATADEVRVLDLANQVRASVGAQPLALDESISVIARRWAATVATAGRISHNPEVGGVTSGSSALAENVVVGPSIATDQAALVASPGHYANMVNPIVSKVGIGVVWAGGMVYIVQDFLIVRGATAPTAPTSPPTTVRPPAAPPATTIAAAGPQAGATPPAPPTSTTVLAGQATAGAVPAAAAGTGPSAWLTHSFEVLRDWERAS